MPSSHRSPGAASSHERHLGNGKCAALIRSHDWTLTPLGDMQAWPAALRILLGTVLNSHQPMLLWWGPHLVQFFNDAYLDVIGPPLAAAMGRRAADWWSEIWADVAPQVDQVMRGEGATWREDSLIPQPRDGVLQDLYWTYGFSPVPSGDGGVLGILVVASDTTERVVGASRLVLLQALSDALARCHGEAEVPAAVRSVAAASRELPELVMAEGLQSGVLRRLPEGPADDGSTRADDTLRRLALRPELLLALRSGAAAPIEGLRAGPGAGAPAPDGFAVPLQAERGVPTDRFVVYTLNVRRAFDMAYRTFLTDFTERIAQTLARLEATRSRALAMQDRDNQLLQAPIATAILLGPDLVFGLANPLYCQVAGRQIQVGTTFEASFPELVGTPLPGLFKQAYRTGQPYVSPETRLMLDRDGSGALQECWFQYNLQPMRTSQGEVYGLMVVAVDMTDAVRQRRSAQETYERGQAALTERGERLEHMVSTRTRELESANDLLKKANQALEVSRDEAQSASRAKSAFVANMSHEIRTPLNGILGLTYLLARDARDERQAERLAQIGRSGQHLLNIINDVLDLSKIEAGKLALSSVDFELDTVLTSTLAMVADAARAKDLRLRLDSDVPPVSLHGDATRLSQALLNLLSNAVKFTDAGSVELRCRATASSDDAVSLRFEVRDTGAGIAQAHQGALFRPFEQGDSSTTRRHGGTGLGLSLTRTFVQAMGGETGFSSVPGQGSTFWAEVPFERAHRAAPDGARHAGTAAPAGGRPASESTATTSDAEAALRLRHGGRRILLAEDNPINRLVAEELLDAVGLVVEAAEDGAAAVELALRRPYDLVLMDMQMPRIDGIAATRLIREGGATLPIVAMTANAFVEDRVRCLAAGMSDHVSKPVDPGELYGVLLKWLPQDAGR